MILRGSARAVWCTHRSWSFLENEKSSWKEEGKSKSALARSLSRPREECEGSECSGCSLPIAGRWRGVLMGSRKVTL